MGEISKRIPLYTYFSILVCKVTLGFNSDEEFR